MNLDQLIYTPLGGVGEVTKNLHVYEYKDEILLVDCGLGFADETMIGVDLLLPDISYLVKSKKKIIGMLLTHGHEDHIGALPFVLPQLPEFPIFATPFTAALANAKISQFGITRKVQEIPFKKDVSIGSFTARFIHVTHSIPDTAHIVLKTPVGNFYHGSDFKFDLTPFDGKKTDFEGIAEVGKTGIRCLMCDSLGAERIGYTPSEQTLSEHFEKTMRTCRGKYIVTTYSSNISRINQIIEIAQKYNKYICFVGRSLMKTRDVAREKGFLRLKKEREIGVDQLKNFRDQDIVLFVAGSQGQENSALARIIDGEHRNVQLRQQDVVIFSSDPIPGNEVSVYALIDALSRSGIQVLYSTSAHEFHVSGHGSQQELLLLMSFLKAKNIVPISGTYRHMVAYKELAESFGYNSKDIIVGAGGQQIIFTKDTVMLGQKIPLRNVYVDEISGEEVEHFVLRDRQKISMEGIVAVIAEVDTETSSVVGKPEIIARGFAAKEVQDIDIIVTLALKKAFPGQRKVSDWNYLRKQLREVTEQKIFKELKRQPLVLPIIIEV